MKIFEVSGKMDKSGEYLLGSKETGSHACYLIYGAMKPGEQGRELKPGHGHEEIVLVLQGALQINGPVAATLGQGQAIHLKDDEAVKVNNAGSEHVVYVIAGGHTGEGHH